MKILQLFDFFSPHGGGTVDLLRKLSQALARRGHEAVIYTSDFKLDREYIASLPEVQVYPFHCVSSLAEFYLTPSIVGEVRKRLKDFDIIHLHCFRSFQNIVIHHYAKKYGIPYVLDTHGSLPRRAAGETRPKWLLRWLFDIAFGNRILRNASRVIAENEFTVREYKGFGIEDDKVALIPLFFPVEDFSHLPSPGQFRNRYGIGEKQIVISLGRIHRIKGLDFLVESFYELSRSREDVILSIVGPDDGYKRKLERLVSKLNLSRRVLFTGFLSGQDKLAALVDANVMVQPSRYEQAAWAPVEAVLCGTPVIVSKDSGAGEDISRMDGGYLVDYGDKRQLVRVIQAILDDPSEASDRVRRAKEHITTNLRLSNKVEDYERLYMECIKENENSLCAAKRRL